MLAYNGSIPGPTLRVAAGRPQSPWTCATTATWRPPCTGTGCGWRTATTGCRTRPRSRSPSAAVHATRCSSRTPASTGTTRTCARTSRRRWASYGTIVVDPADPAYWPPVDRELTITLDDLLVEDGHIAAFRRSGPNFTAMGRFGNVLLINGEPAYAGTATHGRGRAAVPGQHRQHPAVQRRPVRGADEAGRRRQRSIRAGDVRRRRPAGSVGAGRRRRASSTPPGRCGSSTGRRIGPTTSARSRWHAGAPGAAAGHLRRRSGPTRS